MQPKKDAADGCRQLVVSELASPLPKRSAVEKSLFRLWFNNTTVALLSPAAGVVLLEDDESVPRELCAYLLSFQSRSHSKYDLTKGRHIIHLVKKIQHETKYFVWIEKYNLKLTGLLEMALQSTKIVQRGFIESIIVASSGSTDDANFCTKALVRPASQALSPVSVLEFSFDDVF